MPILKHRFKTAILMLASTVAYGSATEEYLCKSFDNESRSEYEWNISITQIHGDIFEVKGSALDDSWHYSGRGFKKDNDMYFYWKLSESHEPGLVHYTIDNTNHTLKGDWMAESATEILTETCTKTS